jgi:hypothetical protein
MPEDTLPPNAKIASAALFDQTRRAMLAAYAEMLHHADALESALEADATTSAMRQLHEIAYG